MNYTDIQLKQALAKMLPETLQIGAPLHGCILYWDLSHTSERVLDTELLYLCWLVEETLKYYELTPYYDDEVSCHSTWQQRTLALAKVKGIEIV
jgi:hypothetical protein